MKTKLNKKIDVGVQSETEMDNKSEKMEQLLQQLLVTQKQKIVENVGTNTDDGDVQIKKTADLLDSLQNALIVNKTITPLASPPQKEETYFKAHVIVENALHLPIRKKCKSRKSKNKTFRKQDECLPSTFVTFETVPEAALKVTPIAHKTANPKWDYRCDVTLPRELLTNVSV